LLLVVYSYLEALQEALTYNPLQATDFRKIMTNQLKLSEKASGSSVILINPDPSVWFPAPAVRDKVGLASHLMLLTAYVGVLRR